MKKNKNFNWGTYITIIGVVVICFIIFTGMVKTIYILPVLGAMCLMYGIFGLIQYRQLKNSESSYSDQTTDGIIQRSMLQLILGAFIIVLGLIEALKINLPENFWNVFLVIIVIVIELWFFVRHRTK